MRQALQWVHSVSSHPNLIAKEAALYASELLVTYATRAHNRLAGDKIIPSF